MYNLEILHAIHSGALPTDVAGAFFTAPWGDETMDSRQADVEASAARLASRAATACDTDRRLVSA